MELRSSLTRLTIVATAAGTVVRGSGGTIGLSAIVPLRRFSARAERQQQHIIEISPKRADILDRNVHELAMSADRGFLLCDPF